MVIELILITWLLVSLQQVNSGSSIQKKNSVRPLDTKTGATKLIGPFNTNQALFYKSPVSQTVHLWSAFDIGTIHQVYQRGKLLKEETFFDGKNKTHNHAELTVI